jgi:F0F1-type ATP synthase assembly protein I
MGTSTGWYGSRAQQRSQSALPTIRDNQRLMDNAAWTISSRLIAGLVLHTGLGWLLSLWLGHRALLMAIGALVGLGLSYYLIFTSLAREGRLAKTARKDGGDA